MRQCDRSHGLLCFRTRVLFLFCQNRICERDREKIKEPKTKQDNKKKI